MSIVVAVRVGEGLVVATDSASTLHAQGPEGQEGVAKVFNHATKVLQLRDYPVAVASWGASQIGSRVIASLVEEYANQRPPLEELEEDGGQLHVKSEAEGLMEFLFDHYEKSFPDWDQMDAPPGGLGVLVGGYSTGNFFPEEYVFNLPQKDFGQLRKPTEEGQQNFGANWYGLTDAIVRLHFGRDGRLPDMLQSLGVETGKIQQLEAAIQQNIQYSVPFAGMPLQDAVDYAIWLVSVAVGRYRFVVGAELCGGPIDVVAITRDKGFQWIQRKKLSARAIGPRQIEEL